jgi:hypothetical protein
MGTIDISCEIILFLELEQSLKPNTLFSYPNSMVELPHGGVGVECSQTGPKLFLSFWC